MLRTLEIKLQKRNIWEITSAVLLVCANSYLQFSCFVVLSDSEVCSLIFFLFQIISSHIISQLKHVTILCDCDKVHTNTVVSFGTAVTVVGRICHNLKFIFSIRNVQKKI
jgi:hypothetical protein